MSNAHRGTAIVGASTTTILSSIGNLTQTEGILHSICLGAGTGAATITLYDAPTATGSPVFVASQSATTPTPSCSVVDLQLVKGLTAVTTGLNVIATVTYK